MKKDSIVRRLETELDEFFSRHTDRESYVELFRKRCDAVYDVKIKKYINGEKTFAELRESIMLDEEKYLE